MAVPPPTVPSVVQGPEQLEISMPIEVRNQGKKLFFSIHRIESYKITLFYLEQGGIGTYVTVPQIGRENVFRASSGSGLWLTTMSRKLEIKTIANQTKETHVVPGSIGEEPKYQQDSYGDSGYMQGQMVILISRKYLF